MYYLDLLMRVLHIFGAVTLGGAIVFMGLAFLPGVARLADDERRGFFDAVRPRWAMLVGIGTGLLLVSGLYNAAMMSIRFTFPEVNYNALLGVKIILAMAIFLLAALLSGRSGAAERMREKLSMWLKITILLLVGVLAIAAVMKSTRHVEKPKNPANAAQTGPSHPAVG